MVVVCGFENVSDGVVSKHAWDTDNVGQVERGHKSTKEGMKRKGGARG